MVNPQSVVRGLKYVDAQEGGKELVDHASLNNKSKPITTIPLRCALPKKISLLFAGCLAECILNAFWFIFSILLGKSNTFFSRGLFPCLAIPCLQLCL